MDMILTLVATTLSFPTVVFLSLLFEGVDRKLHARMQNRIGPPVIQPFYDFVKLFGKERIVPQSAATPIFTAVPVIAAVCAILAAATPLITTLLGVSLVGDLILILYLLAMPSLMLALGGSSSGNPFGAIGFSRSVTMLMSYEVPLIVSVALITLKTGFSITCHDILLAQENMGTPLAFAYPSMVFATATFLLCIPSAVGVVPFDIAEAKTEVVHGPLIEYTGPYLALIKLAKATLSFTLTFLAAILFFYVPAYFKGFDMYKPWPNLGLSLLVAFFIMLCTVTLPRTVFARLKIGQAFKFYWSVPMILCVFSIMLVIIGI
jgi:NADH-quinone oxidoreductase subunit H